ncbi:hypothetical protein ABZ891_34580 [Streptomyces sp. NPDC047023]|uniref:hypothetical protein n=1 Tax=Streptomyces sp. NPDC047023 TaxID=3155139 RepID=UPI0033CCAE49
MLSALLLPASVGMGIQLVGLLAISLATVHFLCAETSSQHCNEGSDEAKMIL